MNVYRLITRHTIEEKILGLQKFKLKTANTVISSDNASMSSMATEQIVDLFSLEGDETSNKKKKAPSGEDGQKLAGGIKAMLDSMPSLWDEGEYAREYDLDKYRADSQKKSNSS